LLRFIQQENTLNSIFLAQKVNCFVDKRYKLLISDYCPKSDIFVYVKLKLEGRRLNQDLRSVLLDVTWEC